MPENYELVKVSITAFEDEDFRIKARGPANPFYLPVNPESFTQSYRVQSITQPKDNKNTTSGLVVAPPEELRLNFIFDGTNTIEGYRYNGKEETVQAQLEMFLDTVFNRKEKIQKPYFLKIVWGKFNFSCVLARLDLHYSLFERNGDPLRIHVNTIFIAVDHLQKITKDEDTATNISPDIKDIKIPDRPSGPNFKFKPPLLNLPIINPLVSPSKRSEEKENPGKLPKVENSLICMNAGLVLLHPFLKTSFYKLGLLHEEIFKNDATKKLALLFLHYLATGRESFLDKEHLIPNLLCGISPELRPAELITLSPGAKEEGEHLLQLAIKTWGALGNTSPDSFRQTFINREGNLIRKTNSTELHVQTQSVDVLLDKLPWSLKMLEFPWMENCLSVMWR